MTPRFTRRWPHCPLLVLAVAIALGATPPATWAQEASTPAAEEITLETSDGIRVAAWFYPPPADAKTPAVVILIHDLGGSHLTVADLARSLQRAGSAVVAPDLRGHGETRLRAGAGTAGKGDAEAAQLLKKADYEAMAAAAGGRVRDQALHRGEIEAVRHWIKVQSDAGRLDIDRLCVVGSGFGGMLAALWTAADWNWPPTTNGPQGQQVRALVLVSPSMSKRGLAMTGPLASEAIRFAVPVMVLAGTSDRDAGRLFDQFKRFRPKEWFTQRDGQPPEKPRELEDASDATAFYLQANTTLSGDKLATDATVNVAEKVKTFISLALARKRE
jgi:dienelactone hydrolase